MAYGSLSKKDQANTGTQKMKPPKNHYIWLSKGNSRKKKSEIRCPK
jgi:hypothetical protein